MYFRLDVYYINFVYFFQLKKEHLENRNHIFCFFDVLYRTKQSTPANKNILLKDKKKQT